MQTHSNNDFSGRLQQLGGVEALQRLADKAKQMVDRGESTITAGAPGEKAIAEATRYCTFIRRLPDDPDCLRISIGEAPSARDETRYLVLRGDPEACAALLERAARALRDSVRDLTP